MQWEDPGWQQATAKLRMVRRELASCPQTPDIQELRSYLDSQIAWALLTPQQRHNKLLDWLIRGG